MTKITLAVEPAFVGRVNAALREAGLRDCVRIRREELGHFPRDFAMRGALEVFRIGAMPRGGWPHDPAQIGAVIREAVGYPTVIGAEA